MKNLLVLIAVSVLSFPTFASNRLGLNLGAVRSAPNVGVTYDSADSTGSLGGHFFFQTEKTTAGLGGLISFAGHFKINLVDQNRFSFEAYPGAGLHIVKNSGAAGDKTTIGPTLRFRALYRLSSGTEIGLDQLEVWNWTDENAAASGSFTAFVIKLQI
jgi:hypothetical protein